MKKTLFAIIGTGLCLCAALTGCGKTAPATYEKLIEVYKDSFEKVDATLTSNFSVDYSDEDSGTYGTLLDLDVTVDIQSTDNVSYADVYCVGTALGMSQTIHQFMYSDSESVYTQEEGDDYWIASENNSLTYSDILNGMSILPDYLTDAELEEYQEDDTYYTITGKLNVAGMIELFELALEEDLDEEDLGAIGANAIDVTLTFSTEDNSLCTMTIAMETATEYEEASSETESTNEDADIADAEETDDDTSSDFYGLHISNISIEVTFNDTADMADVTIPDDVVESTTEEDPNNA